MQTQRVNREDAEKIFLVVHNVSGATATTGLGMRLVGGTGAQAATSTDGIQSVLLDADGYMPLLLGVTVEDIADDGYGRVQAYGYVDSVLLSAEANKTVGVVALNETFLKKGGTAGSFTSTQTPQALSTFAYKYVQALTTTNISGGLNYCSGFVRAV